MTRAATAATAPARLPRHERFLLRWVLILSFVAAHLAERNRHRCRDPLFETVMGYCFFAAAAALAWLCRHTSRDPKRFTELLVTTRRDVFHEGLTVETPLAVVSMLWSDPRVTIVHTTCVNFHYLYLLADEKIRFLVSAHWAKFPVNFLWHRVVVILAAPFGGVDRVTWLGNTLDEVAAARRHGQRSGLVNHNCFINEAHFPLLSPRRAPRFDAVLNANAGSWKRHYLARDIESLAYITYSHDGSGKMIWPVDSFAPAFSNEAYLDEAELRAIYSDACCGLALSACEGGNYATTEFLLSGVPIVSTRSLGGRDVWFTEANSLICEASCEAVAAAVRVWRQRHESGLVDHERIRTDCLAQMQEHRERFVAILQEVLDQEQIPASARAILEEHRAQDRMLHSLTCQRSQGPYRHPFAHGKGWHPLTALPFN